MNSHYAKRGTIIILVLLLVFLAAGLLAIFGASLTDLVRTNRVESDRLALRQAIDSGGAWAQMHVDDWPMSGNQPQPVRLEMPSQANSAVNTRVAIYPLETSGKTVLAARVDAVLHRRKGHGATKSIVVTINRPLKVAVRN